MTQRLDIHNESLILYSNNSLNWDLFHDKSVDSFSQATVEGKENKT